jgi:hypothetical protein
MPVRQQQADDPVLAGDNAVAPFQRFDSRPLHP